MKILAPIVVVLAAAGLFFGGHWLGTTQTENNLNTNSPAFEKAAQAGQLATIVQIIEQADKNPCQAINLFNRADTDNPKEVNLINVTCESLGLPDLNEDAE